MSLIPMAMGRGYDPEVCHGNGSGAASGRHGSGEIRRDEFLFLLYETEHGLVSQILNRLVEQIPHMQMEYQETFLQLPSALALCSKQQRIPVRMI